LAQIIAENTSDNPIYESEIMVFDQGQINLCPKVQHEGKENILIVSFNHIFSMLIISLFNDI